MDSHVQSQTDQHNPFMAPEEPARAPELFSLRSMQTGDLDQVARLHEVSLDYGFFGRLGNGFLRVYYETFISSPCARAFVGEFEDGSSAGMIVGTIDNEHHYQWLLRRRGAALAISGLRALLRRPRLLAWFLRSRVPRYVRAVTRRLLPQSHRPSSTLQPERVGVLSHVAVSPTHRSSGLGAALVKRFVAEAEESSMDRVLLVTLTGEEGAGRFYERLGWEHLGDKVDHDGRRVATYELRLKTGA